MSATEVRSHPNETVQALHDLTAALEAAGREPRQIALNVSEVISRSGLGRLNLTDYLYEHGFVGVRLAKAIGTFGVAVRDGYEARYGHKPLQHVRDDNGNIVWLYLELDRPLVDDVFAEWSK